ncbi:TPA: hypothetical protein ACX6Q0_000014 [Photobacterium damselae]
METKEKSNLQEKIVRLYLRLNGFITDGFIAHSDTHGVNLAETDVIGVRFPFHIEREREVTVCEKLQIQDDSIHVFVGEVKSHGQQLQFNNAITSNIEVTKKVFKRIGIIPAEQVDEQAESIHRLFQHQNFTNSTPSRMSIGGTHYVVSALMFKPETDNQNRTQSYFITGTDIFSYIWSCFRPTQPRCGCATTYDYSTWGEYEELVNYFKDPRTETHGNMRDLYNYVEQAKAQTEN